MSDSENMEQFSKGFTQLSDESREYILAIMRALLFASNHASAEKKPSPVGPLKANLPP